MGGLKRGRPLKRVGARPREPDRPVPSSNSSLFGRATVAARRAGGRGRAGRLARVVPALAEVLRLDVADVQEPVPADAEIDERGLDAGLQVDHHALVDVSYVIVLPGPLHVELFEHAVFNDRDPAFFRLGDVDQHFLFHVLAFSFGNVDEYACGERQAVRLLRRSGRLMRRPPRRCGAAANPCRSISPSSSARSTSRGPRCPDYPPAAASAARLGSGSTPAAAGAGRGARGPCVRSTGQDGAAEERSIRRPRPARSAAGTGAS